MAVTVLKTMSLSEARIEEYSTCCQFSIVKTWKTVMKATVKVS